LKGLSVCPVYFILQSGQVSWYVVLNTKDYKHKISSLLEESAYRKLTKDPTEI
jgi:hypothetical protein